MKRVFRSGSHNARTHTYIQVERNLRGCSFGDLHVFHMQHTFVLSSRISGIITKSAQETLT